MCVFGSCVCLSLSCTGLGVSLRSVCAWGCVSLMSVCACVHMRALHFCSCLSPPMSGNMSGVYSHMSSLSSLGHGVSVL